MSSKTRSGCIASNAAQAAGALGMRAAGEGKDAHARLLGRGDAGRTVLDDDAVFGRHAHLARHVQEEVGRRLAARHHGGAEDMRLEADREGR